MFMKIYKKKCMTWIRQCEYLGLNSVLSILRLTSGARLEKQAKARLKSQGFKKIEIKRMYDI